jgi:hypothetical protein
LLFASNRACSRADNFLAFGSFLAVLEFDLVDRSFFADLESLADDFLAVRELLASLRLVSFFLTSAFADAVGFFAVVFFFDWAEIWSVRNANAKKKEMTSKAKRFWGHINFMYNLSLTKDFDLILEEVAYVPPG